MKILEVVNSLSSVHGGSAEAPYQLSKELAKMGHDVTIYTANSDRLVPQVKVRVFKSYTSWSEFYITPSMIREAREEVRRFDVIHMHNYRTFQNLVVYYYARKYDIPYVLQAHGSLATFFQKGMLKKAFDAAGGDRILKDAKAIASSEAEAAQYRNMGIDETKIEIVPNGVDLLEFEDLPQSGEFKKKYGLEGRVVLFLGRIHKTKGLDLLAEAFVGLPSDVKLVIAGPDGGYLKPLKKLLAALKIDVLFTGPLYGKAKLSAYVDADVFVLSSSYEDFGMAAIEAMACGTPVVTTDRCGISEIIDNAGVVVAYDEAALRCALLKVLNDNEMRHELGEKGRSLVHEELNWQKVARRIVEMYEEVQR